jgi:predicted transcriptional regulator
MFEMSHPSRIGMLRLAAGGPVRHRDMLQASGLAPSEVTRHAGRLVDSGFLKRNRAGHFELTRLGGLLLDRMDDFEFISFHDRFFERHDITGIPAGFDVFPMLRRTTILEETMAVVNAVLRINAGSGEYVNCILDEFNDALVAVQTEKLRDGLELNILTRSGRAVPSEYVEHRHAKLNIRTMAKLPIFMIASEKESVLCLRGSNGRTDYSMAFVSGKPEFLDWCEALFWHYWERGRNVGL